MRKRLVFLITVVLAISSINIQSFGKSISELQKERDEIKNSQSEIKSKLNEVTIAKTSTQKELDDVDVLLNKTTEDLFFVEKELDNTKQLLAKTEEDLVNATDLKNVQYENLKKRVKFMYENGNTGYLEVILESKDISDLLNRIEYVNIIVMHDKNLVKDLEKTEDIIETKVIETKSQKAEVEVLVNQKTLKVNELAVKLKQKQTLVEKLTQDEGKYNEQISDLEQSDKNITEMIKKAEAEAEAKRIAKAKADAEAAKQKEKVPKSNVGQTTAVYTGGKLAWPVPSRSSISSSYGYRKRPIGSGSEFHSGIDIPAPTGSAIVSAEDGVVVSASTMNGYGKTVVISHGGGLSTLYAHNSVLVVRAGDSVKRGQVIAKAGSTGWSTGPHCHFEVRLNGSHTNPINYVR